MAQKRFRFGVGFKIGGIKMRKVLFMLVSCAILASCGTSAPDLSRIWMGQGGNPMRTSSMEQDILAPFGSKWQVQMNGTRISTVAVAAVPMDVMENIKGMSVVERLVFASSSDGSVYAIDFNFGDKIWEKKMPQPVNSPIYDSGKVMVASQDGMVRALDAWTGNEIWASKFSDKNLDRTENMSLVADNGVVFGAFSSKKAIAFDISDGSIIWSVDLKDEVQASGVVADGKFIFATYEPAIIALSVDDGKELWKQSCKNPANTSLVCNGTNVYVPTAFGIIVAYDLKEGKRVWETDINGIIPFGSCIKKDWFVVGNGNTKAIHFINLKDGETKKTIKVNGIASGLINAGNFILFAGDDSKLYAMELSNFTVTEAYNFGQGAINIQIRPYPDPVAIAGRVYASDGKDKLHQLLPRMLLEDKSKINNEPTYPGDPEGKDLPKKLTPNDPAKKNP